ncbi:hypothetical protein [Streptomyces europaeiscabiei]|uniref:hypothetical protein n=1 Tax=Streptomyces europaeiscabiei TaxID=146819 RepID=UPI002E289286|nr:hypothetical protein [Streptomyces europaeiscabiei]
MSDAGDTRTSDGEGGRTDRNHRTPIIAAVITGAATVVASVIAAVLEGGGTPKESPAAVTTSQQTSAASPTAPPTTSQPVQTLPPTSSAPEPSPTAARIVASPDSAAEGTVITITGSGFAAGEQVRIIFNGTYGNMIDLRDVTAGSDGGFAAQIKVPDDSVNSDQPQSFEARGLESQSRADTPFHITG